MSESVEPSAGPGWGAEARELMARDPRLGIPLPAYGGRSIPNLTVSLAHAVGRPDRASLPLPGLAPVLDPFHGGRLEGTVVVFLVDGLGWLALHESAARQPGGPASRWVGLSKPLTSVFPTTTTVALTSLSTGAAPGQHGVVGHRVYLPRFDTVAELLRMSPLGVGTAETLVGPDWTPSVVSAVPSLFRRGLPAVAVSRDRYQGSGFTRLLYDGAEFVAYATLGDFASALVDLLSRSEPPPVVFAYWDDLDVTEHLRGPLPGLLDLEVDRVASLLAFVAHHLEPRVARRSTLILTGDHGQVPMAPDHQLIADQDRGLLDLLAHPPSGDRRATYFSARPGRRSELKEVLEARRPPRSHLLEMPDAVEGGLYGPAPFHPELSSRLGDFLLLMPSPGGVSYTVLGNRPRGRPMKGAHGGLEPDELLVPMVAGSFEEVAAGPWRSSHLRPAPSGSA